MGESKDGDQGRKRILVCDDEAWITEFLSELLGFNGFYVEALNEPRQVVSRLEEGTFNLVILDLMMPARDGGSIVKELRERDDELADIPVIVLSAKRLDPRERSFLRRAKASLVEKPIKIDEIVLAVRQGLSTGKRT